MRPWQLALVSDAAIMTHRHNQFECFHNDSLMHHYNFKSCFQMNIDDFETIKYERNNPKKFFENKSSML